MKARILPVEEWPRLVGTEAEAAWPYLNPENTRVIVVEEAGEIVGTWTMLRIVHAECLWISPKYRGSFGVAKRLLRGMREIATGWGVEKVITGSASEHVTALIAKFGGVPMPCVSFILPVNGTSPQRTVDRALGNIFHRQLEAQVVEGLHPDDEQHDEHVGRALRTAIRDKEPARAMDEYNAWASTAGYEPIRYLGTFDGRLRADIVTAVIEVDDQYAVRVVGQEVEACR